MGERRVRNAEVEGSIPFHSTRILPAQEIKRAARSNERPVSFAAATYFELEPVLPEPMPLEPPVLPAPDGLLLLGDALEPLEDDEPPAASFTHFSFSAPVRLAHWAGVLVELPLALGEEPLAPLGDELLPALGVLPAPWDDESAAMTAVEAANSTASVAAESTFNIVAFL